MPRYSPTCPLVHREHPNNHTKKHKESDRKTGRKTVSRPIFSHANHIPAPCAINRSYQFSRLCNFDSSFFFAWLGHCEWPSINWAVIIYLFPCMGFFALPKWLPKDAPTTLQYWILLKNEDSLGVFLKNQRMLSGTIVQCQWRSICAGYGSRPR